MNAVNQATNNALGTVAEKTEKARISISEVANQAVSRVSETTNKAVDAVLTGRQLLKKLLIKLLTLRSIL